MGHIKLLASAAMSILLLIGSVSFFPAAAETVLNVATTADMRGTNPGVDRDGTTDTIHMHVVEGLVAYASDFSVRPMLAESIDLSKDGLTYTFKLRKGVKFHNGEEMKGAHVKWSWDRFMKPETKWRCRNNFNGKRGVAVTKFEIVDDYTVKMHLSEPSAVFLASLARFDCGSTAVLHPDSVDSDGKWLKPIGTGPFVFGEIKPGRYTELIRFKDYSARSEPRNGYVGKKEVLVDRVKINVLPEATVQKSAFMAGDLDIISVQPSDVAEVEKHPGCTINSSETAVWDTLLINSRDSLLSDKRIRQSIAHAINREQVIAVISEGRARANPSPVPPLSSYFSNSLKAQLPYDVNKAKALLEEAGYKGEPLKILTTRRSGAYYERALVIQSMLEAAGMKVDMQVLEWGAMLDAYKKGQGYQMMSFTYSARLDPALSFDMFTGPEKRKAWKDSEAIKLVEEAHAVSDPTKRQKLIDELHSRFIDQVPAVGLGHRQRFLAVRKGITGFKAWGAGKARYWGVSVK